MHSGIYAIVNVANAKQYIGSAADLHQRFREHRSLLSRGRHHSRHLQNAWRRYGQEAFVFIPLVRCAPHDLLFYEQRALDVFRPEYNTAPRAGNTLGVPRSPEARAKIAAKARGRQWSDEAKAKLSATLTGRQLSEAHRQTLIGNKRAAGHKHTAEWKAHISGLNIGKQRPKSPEHRAKIAATLKGIGHSPERRAAQAAGQLGKKRGPYKLKRNEVCDEQSSMVSD